MTIKRVVELPVGEWLESSDPPLRQFKEAEELIAHTMVYNDHEAGIFHDTGWRLYKRDDGRYLLYWWSITAPRGWTNTADYVILDDLPVQGTVYEGTRGYKSPAVPEALVENSK